MGRTHSKHGRLYVGGYELSAYVLQVGPLVNEWEFDEEATLTSNVMAVLGGLGRGMPRFGEVNGVFDDTATHGLHALHSAPGSSHVVTYAQGIGAAPAQGDPVFCGQWTQTAYMPDPNKVGAVGARIVFGAPPSDGALLDYGRSWGVLLHPNSAITGANSSPGVDDYGAATSAGGFGVLHILDGDGTATISIEAAATNTDTAFDNAGALLTFDTTDMTTPAAEIKTLATNATVERYLRWQVTLGSATTLTAVIAFVRGL